MYDNAITATADDQRAVRRGIRRYTASPWFIVVMLVAGIGALTLSATSVVTGNDAVFVFVAGAIMLLSLAALIWMAPRRLAKTLVIGSDVFARIDADGFEQGGPTGSTRMPWTSLRSIERVGDSVVVRLTPTKTRLVFPGRLFSDEAIAEAQRLIAAAHPGARPRR